MICLCLIVYCFYVLINCFRWILKNFLSSFRRIFFWFFWRIFFCFFFWVFGGKLYTIMRTTTSIEAFSFLSALQWIIRNVWMNVWMNVWRNDWMNDWLIEWWNDWWNHHHVPDKDVCMCVCMCFLIVHYINLRKCH